MTEKRAKLTRRKLLVATAGLATVKLTACSYGTSGNLVAPPPHDAAVDAAEARDAGRDAGTDANDHDTGSER